MDSFFDWRQAWLLSLETYASILPPLLIPVAKPRQTNTNLGNLGRVDIKHFHWSVYSTPESISVLETASVYTTLVNIFHDTVAPTGLSPTPLHCTCRFQGTNTVFQSLGVFPGGFVVYTPFAWKRA